MFDVSALERNTACRVNTDNQVNRSVMELARAVRQFEVAFSRVCDPIEGGRVLKEYNVSVEPSKGGHVLTFSAPEILKAVRDLDDDGMKALENSLNHPIRSLPIADKPVSVSTNVRTSALMVQVYS